MPAHGLPPQQFLTWPLLVGTDGTRKMSKSYDNYVAITDEPNDMYGKVMSLTDAVMRDYFETLTDIPTPTLEEMFADMAAERRNPRDVKALLAREIVTQFHDEASAHAAEAEFVRMFRQGALPTDIPIIALNDALREAKTIVDALIAANLASSKSEARRLVKQGGVRLDNTRITDTNAPFCKAGANLPSRQAEIWESGRMTSYGSAEFRPNLSSSSDRSESELTPLHSLANLNSM